MNYGNTVAHIGRRMLGLADLLTKDIPDERFARLPRGAAELVQTNHPAFVLGHLCVSAARVGELVGDADAQQQAAVPAGWIDLFRPGAACRDDAENRIYPGRPELLRHFQQGYEAAITAAERADPSVWEQETPIERIRAFAPTVGIATGFLLGSHTMFHLGQLSAWRRFEGLPPAMKM